MAQPILAAAARKLAKEIENVRAPPPDAAQEAKRLLYAGVASVVLMHDVLLGAAAFSPDGRRIVSASHDKTLRLWNSDGSGKPPDPARPR